MTQTPILNRELPPPATTPRTVLRYWLPFALAGAAIGFLRGFFHVGALPALPPGQDLLIWLIPVLYFSILVHELGHLVAGVSVGFELRTLMAAAFLLTREAQRWRVRVIPRRVLAGGLTGMVPRSADRLVPRYIRFGLGGPLASLALLIVAAIVRSTGRGGAGVDTLLAVNLLIVISASVPYTWRGHTSDGKLLVTLARQGPAADHLAAMLYILALDTQQVEPRDWPTALVETISVPTKDSLYLPGAITISYADALDSGDADRIANAIERALAASADTQPDMRRAFYASAASFHGVFRHDVARAEAWLDDARKIKGAVAVEDWDSKALGSIALAKGERSEARECLTRYVALLDRHPASGSLAAERRRTVEFLESLA